jgi:hypothetical protein
VYGYPSALIQDASERGEVILGGCLVGPDNPNWGCKRCGTRYRVEKEEHAWRLEQTANLRKRQVSDEDLIADEIPASIRRQGDQ